MPGPIGKLTVWLTMNTKGFSAGVAKANTQMAGLGKGIGRMAGLLGPFTGALAAAGAAIGGLLLIKKVTEIGAEFEQQIETAGAVMRATAGEMDNLSSTAKMLGETTEFTAAQAAEGLRFLGMAGFSVTEAIGALPGVLDLATAAQLDLGRSADIASNILSSFALEVNELGRVNDVMVGTFTRSNTNMEQLAEAMKYSSAVANSFGYEIEELSGLIGKLGDRGVQGSMAGTQLAFAMQKSAKVAQEMGLESANLLDVLDAMTAQGAEATDFLKAFGQRGGRAALILKDITGEVRDFQKELKLTDGEAKRLADTMRSTLQGRFKELQSAIQSLAIDGFEGFKKDLKVFVTDITAFVRENKDQIVDFITIVGQATISMVKVISNLLEPIKVFTDEVIAAFSSSTDQLQENGTKWLRFFTFMEKTSKNTAQVFIFFGRSIKAFFDATGKNIANFVLTTKEIVESLGGALVAVAEGDITKAIEAFKNVGTEFNNGLERSSEIGTEFNKSIKDGWDGMIDKMETRSIDELVLAQMERVRAAADKEFIKNVPVFDPEQATRAGGIRGAFGNQDALQNLPIVPLPEEKEHVRNPIFDEMMRLEEESARTARVMARNFKGLFLDVAAGEFKTFGDFAKSVFDSLLDAIIDVGAQMAAEGLAGMFKKDNAAGGEGGGAGFLSSIAGLFSNKFAEGGIVTGPTLATVGEAGPEAIIPLSDLSSLGGGGGTTININGVQDAGSFQKNQSQIMAQIAVAVDQSRNRDR